MVLFYIVYGFILYWFYSILFKNDSGISGIIKFRCAVNVLKALYSSCLHVMPSDHLTHIYSLIIPYILMNGYQSSGCLSSLESDYVNNYYAVGS